MRPLTLRLPHLLAASLLVMPPAAVAAQSAPASRPPAALHDSIDVASLEFDGATAVSPDDLKRIVFTRT